MNLSSALPCTTAYPLTALLALLASPVAQAAILGPGQTANVPPGNAPESWTLSAATLNVGVGASTLEVFANPLSTVTFSGGQASTAGVDAVTLVDSNGSFDGATLTSAGSFGLSLTTDLNGTRPGSVATLLGSTSSGFERGVNITGNSRLDAEDSRIVSTGAGSVGMAVFGATVTLRNSNVTGADTGVFVADDAVVNNVFNLTLDNGSSVTGTTGTGILILLDANPAQGTLTIANGSTVTGGNGTMLDVADTADLSLVVDNSQLVGNVTAVESATVDATLLNGASITGNLTNLDSLRLNASSVTGDFVGPVNDPAGVVLENGSTYNGVLRNFATLVVDGSTVNGSIEQAPGSSARVNMTSGSSLKGDVSNVANLSMNASTLIGNVTQGDVELSNGSTLQGDLNDVASLRLDASVMTGNVNQGVGSTATLDLINGASLIGSVTDAQAMNIDAGSRWVMAADSSLGALALNGGSVELNGSAGNFRTLTLASLSGSGTFGMGTDLAGHLSDFIDVQGSADGAHTLRVQNTGVEPVAEDVPQRLVHTGSGPASFAVAGGAVDVGTYQYRLEQRGTDWFLVQATKPVDPVTPVDPVDPVDPVKPVDPVNPVDPVDPVNPVDPVDPVDPVNPVDPVDPGKPGDGGDPIITPSTRAVIGVFSAAPTVWYGEQASLLSRMGEVRNGNSTGGAWARTYGNKYSVSPGDQVRYTQQQSGVSLGADVALPASDGQWLVGVMGGYSNSNLDLQRGTSGDVNSYYVGVYSTWRNRTGYYVDALIKANRFHNKADVLMSDGVKAKGDYDNHGIGGSVEVGKRIELPDAWYLEPFAQASALWVDGQGYDLDNGMQAHSNHANSMLGKVGTHIGKRLPLQGGGYLQPYMKVAVAQEFARSNRVNVNGHDFEDDLSGTRAEFGAGVAAQVTDVLQLHADTAYSRGENIEQRWGVNIGVRYLW